MTDDKENGSNRWFLSRLAALGVGGLLAKAAPYVVLTGAAVIAVDGIVRWRRIRRRREARKAAYVMLEVPERRIFEEEEGGG